MKDSEKPVTVCSGIIEKDGKFLLVNAMRGVPKGLWNNPGGRIEEGEGLEECAKREVKEETGYDAEIGKLVGVVIYKNKKRYIFEAKILRGKLSLQEGEIEKAEWFSLEEMKKLKNITIGTLQSAEDYMKKKYNQTYNVDVWP
ncbi:MAG TPA: NUDIX hydrolase [archaeon]|nr:NUDIX hydrolase [archaeon]